jgi:hypothetical protein
MQVAHLIPDSFSGLFRVGTEMALDGDFAYLTLTDSPGGFGNGRVDVFQRNSAGAWNEIAELSSPITPFAFGFSLAVNGGKR